MKLRTKIVAYVCIAYLGVRILWPCALFLLGALRGELPLTIGAFWSQFDIGLFPSLLLLFGWIALLAMPRKGWTILIATNGLLFLMLLWVIAVIGIPYTLQHGVRILTPDPDVTDYPFAEPVGWLVFVIVTAWFPLTDRPGGWTAPSVRQRQETPA